MLLDSDRCRLILDAALAVAEGTQVQAEGLLSAGRETVTRFAMNRVHQNVAEEDVGASFRVADGGRVGGARTNGTAPERLAECVRRASEIARAQPPDDEFPGLVKSPQAEDRGLADYDEETAGLSPEECVKAALPAIEKAREAGLEASGALTISAGETAVANSLGTFQHHASTSVQLHVVARKGAAEGAWTETATKWSGIDPERVAARALEKALASREPVEVDPEEIERDGWAVVLEPDAVADILGMLAYIGLGAQSVIEGRSFMSGRLGEKVCSERITIVDDAFDARGAVRPFDYEGVPTRRVALIEKGVALGPVHDARTAKKAGVESTGHALPRPNTFGPYPMNLRLEPGEATLDEMIASTERGILVSRFHYTNPVDPRRTVITGMTRFGTFLVENGKVTKAVRSMRFTDNVIEALSRVEAVGKELRRVDDVLAPALKLSSWRFTGATGE